MVPYWHIMLLCVLFRVVWSRWLRFPEKRVKITKFHERLFYLPEAPGLRVAISAWPRSFRVAWSTLPFRVAMSAKKRVKNAKYAIRVARSATAGPGLSCSETAGCARLISCSRRIPHYTKKTQP